MNSLFDINDKMNIERERLRITDENNVLNMYYIFENLYNLYDELKFTFENKMFCESIDAIEVGNYIVKIWTNLLFP